MKRALSLLIILLLTACLYSCNADDKATTTNSNIISTSKTTTQKKDEEKDMSSFYITANGTTFTAQFADNSSAEAFKEILSKNDLTLNLSDYGNFEKVGPIGHTLPRNDKQISTNTGDIILYQGSNICIYYGKNSWSFTRLGKIENVTKAEMLEALGYGDVTVTISLTK